MQRPLALLLGLVLLFSCTKPVKKVSAAPPERLAIAIEYVAVPTMNVYTAPRPDAPVTTSYGINETVSVLAKQGEWTEVRTVDGSGWVHEAELMTAEQAKALEENPTPRFLRPPAAVQARARGEIDLNAKVNTDGDVVEVKVVKNTTGNHQLGSDTANALMAAKFYPMVQKGQRMTFTYEHKVYY